MASRGIRSVLVLVGVLLSLSCERAVPVFQEGFTPSSASCSSRDQFLDFTVVSQASWELLSSEPWCIPVPMDGGPTSSKGARVRVHLDENEKFERSCVVSLRVDGEVVGSAEITQSQNTAGLYFDKTAYKVSGQTRQVVIPFFSDTEVTVESLCSWITSVKVDRQSLLLDVDPYDSLINRQGQVLVKTASGKEQVIDIVQGDGFTNQRLYDLLVSLYDSDHDGAISREEADGIETMYLRIDTDWIKMVDGFGFFRNLKELKIRASMSPWAGREYCFDGHPALTSVTIEEDFGFTRFSARNCPQLEDVALSISFSNEMSFDVGGCSHLQKIQISSSRTTFSSFSMDNCPDLREIRLGKVIFPGEVDFRNCNKLQSLYLNNVYGINCVDLSQDPCLKDVFLNNTAKYLLISKDLKGSINLSLVLGTKIIYQ